MKLIVGISGATGSVYGIRTLQVLAGLGVETHLIMTEHAERNILLDTYQVPGSLQSSNEFP